MTERNEPEIDNEKYEFEIKALRRVNERAKSLRNWLMNTSLASLAFFITILTQIRLDGSLPLSWLGLATFLLLASAVVIAGWLKFRFELESNFLDLRDSTPLFREVLKMVENSDSESEETKRAMKSTLGKTVEAIEGFSNTNHEFAPLSELKRLAPTVAALVLGLVGLLSYVGIYYFG